MLGRLRPAALALACLAAPAGAATVVHVASGDTLTVREDGRLVTLRLAAIGALDVHHPMGLEARKALARLAFNREVRVVWDEPVPGAPASARVFAGATDLAAALVERGLAWVCRDAAPPDALLALERRARAEGRGMWAARLRAPPPGPCAAR